MTIKSLTELADEMRSVAAGTGQPSPLPEPKLHMYLIVRGDLEDVTGGLIPTGKLMGQAGHGFCTALIQVIERNGLVARYYADNQPKIVLKVKNLHALLRAETECKEAGLNHFLVTDAGHTIFKEPTQTCLAIGPCYKSELPKFISRMQLF